MYNVPYLSKEYQSGDYLYEIYYGYNWINHLYIKKQIEPKRISFMVCDMIKKNINNQFPNLLDVEFEEVIDDGTKLRYDITISLSKEIIKECNIDEEYKIIIIIEIQENNSNHIFNPNDNTKNYVVNSKGIIIKYFFENKIKEIDYECTFYANILDTCNEVLIAVSKNYRNKNILLETQIISKKKIEKLMEELEYINEEQKEIVNKDIKRWKFLSDDLDNTTQQVKKIYEYKIEAYENLNKIIFYDYNIPLDFIFDNLRISSKKSKKYYDHLNNLVYMYSRSIKNKYYFSYESVNKFIGELHIETNEQLKIHFMNILLCTQEIYENYINIIQKYNQSIISKLRKDNKVVKDIITEKIEKKFNTIIKNYEIENNIKDCQIKNLKSILNNKNIKNNKNSKKLELSYNDETEFVKDINLQIYFSKNREKYISSQEALAIMINNGLKKKESENLLNTFYKNFNDCRKLEFIENETIPHLYCKH